MMNADRGTRDASFIVLLSSLLFVAPVQRVVGRRYSNRGKSKLIILRIDNSKFPFAEFGKFLGDTDAPLYEFPN
jgi:hypothetical protein